MEKNEGCIILDTPEEINMYAFLMLRKAVEFRIKTGMSLLRKQEAQMAKNYGWSNKRSMKAILADLDAIAKEIGI